MQYEIKTIQFGNAKLVSDIFPAHTIPSVLFLHGAGTSDRRRFDRFREQLALEKISSCALDFIGHGETGGEMSETSLKERTDQAATVIQALGLPKPLHIVAASMGGYTAIKLTELFDVETLIFLAPAVYSKEAYDVVFGTGFTDIIRRERSWDDTDAWEILNRYKGNLLIYIGEHDEVVPYEVVQKIYDSATCAKHREICIIKNAAHPLGKYLQEHAADLDFVVRKSIEILK